MDSIESKDNNRSPVEIPKLFLEVILNCSILVGLVSPMQIEFTLKGKLDTLGGPPSTRIIVIIQYDGPYPNLTDWVNMRLTIEIKVRGRIGRQKGYILLTKR
ncbi:MAG: hypothetical protein ACRD8Z_16365, partial [Nitrososphaeraceae archaeon]